MKRHTRGMRNIGTCEGMHLRPVTDFTAVS